MQLPILPITVLLVFARFAALTCMTVVFGRRLVPIRVRIALAMALSWFVLGNLPPEWRAYCQNLNDTLSIVTALLGEVLLGLALGLVFDMFFAVLNMTSVLFARESALMMATMLDPTNDEQTVFLSTLFSITFTTLIFLWGGHIFLVKLVIGSFEFLPPGFFWFREELMDMYVQLGGDIFSWGIRFALPVMAGGMIVAVCMGLIAKMAPEFNVLILSLPFRLFTGITILCLFILYGSDPLYKVFETMLRHIEYLWGRGGVRCLCFIRNGEKTVKPSAGPRKSVRKSAKRGNWSVPTRSIQLPCWRRGC